MISDVGFGCFSRKINSGVQLAFQKNLHKEKAASSLSYLDKDVFSSALNQEYKNDISFLGNIQRSIKEAWKDSIVREMIEKSVMCGNFKECPEFGKAFLERIDALCSSKLSNDEIYKELSKFFEKIRPQIDNSFATDDEKRFQRRVGQVKDILGNKKVEIFTDVGCGDGEITSAIGSALKLKKDKVTGLEVYIRPDKTYPFTIKQFDGVKIPLPDNSQDLVTLFTVLHHAENPDGLLKEIRRILSPNGKLIVREFDAKNDSEKLFNVVMDEMLYKVYTSYDGVPVREDGYHSCSEWEIC
ncbi:MAG: hypothetical protein A2287_07025 [Candidatus Melainabacteria bacterium RIFOXYA12_FULL_32_12]|nr:MAG: hypothetical protein A2255_07645 [Candidatus Melainabacteria bacterium RIFOXYA2_FULL_32_9]OGI24225.1 MAG: hypothetical protein A2287_07025 [Candidatus Melainabacteria bacterium RIFOXYA12_FULL_32_12]